ncbi:low molecular weight phosphatase family protein [Demequina sp. SO4-13]|uniref:arsenate reductase/protein-tyrosine-phosphatase family protein n=1 Tax=Demequina sp. SO4-13 TaxID=3401027 RepID=UPI003AF6ED16
MTTVLTVCTGNICRSPAVEALLRHHLGDIADFSSAGTHAMTDTGIPAQMLMGLDAAGIDARAHRSRQLTESLAREADLIIAMTAEHRTRIVQEVPSVLRRTFLLDELAKAAREQAPLEGDSPAERLRNIPDAIQGFRPELSAFQIEDVPDPYRRSQDDYDRAYAMIEAAVRDISAWVRG